MFPRSLIDTPIIIRSATQNYVSPTERVVTAERINFLSVLQGVVESDDHFLARLRKEAQYCDFENSKQRLNPKRSW